MEWPRNHFDHFRAAGAHGRMHLAGARHQHASAEHEHRRLDIRRQWWRQHDLPSGKNRGQLPGVLNDGVCGAPEHHGNVLDTLGHAARPILPLSGRPRRPVPPGRFEGRRFAGPRQAGRDERGDGKPRKGARARHPAKEPRRGDGPNDNRNEPPPPGLLLPPSQRHHGHRGAEHPRGRPPGSVGDPAGRRGKESRARIHAPQYPLVFPEAKGDAVLVMF